MAKNTKKCSVEDYEKVIYDGETKNKIYISFNGTELENADYYCEKFTVKSRLLKNGNNYFSLDNFVSKEATLIIHNIDIETIQDPIKISIGTYIDKIQDYEIVDIGYFLIQDKPKNDKDKITISLRDYSVKLDFNYNAKPIIDEKGGEATLYDILEDICEKVNISWDSDIYYTMGIKDKTALYDNTVNARTYISYIAEHCGRIATINSNGSLVFADLNGDVTSIFDINPTIDNAIERPVELIQIDGKSTQATRSGKNLLPVFEGTVEYFGRTYEFKDGILTVTGVSTEENAFCLINGGRTSKYADTTKLTISNSILLKAGTYRLHRTKVLNDATITIKHGDLDTLGTVLNLGRDYEEITFTLEQDEYVSLMFYDYRTDGTKIIMKDFQIELGTVFTGYEQYGVSPSPDYPSEIECLKGKNLLNNVSPDSSSTATWVATSTGGFFTASSTWLKILWKFELEVGKVYTLSYGKRNSTAIYTYVDSYTDNTYGTRKTKLISDGTALSNTFVADSKYIIVSFQNNAVVSNIDIPDIQLKNITNSNLFDYKKLNNADTMQWTYYENLGTNFRVLPIYVGTNKPIYFSTNIPALITGNAFYAINNINDGSSNTLNIERPRVVYSNNDGYVYLGVVTDRQYYAEVQGNQYWIYISYDDGSYVSYNTIQVKNIGKNLFDKNSSETQIGYFTSDGTLKSGGGSTVTTTYTKVKPNIDMTISGIKLEWLCFYDKNKNFIERIAGASGSTSNIFNKNANYIRFQASSSVFDLDKIQLELGTQATTYEPYQESITNIDLQGNELCSLQNNIKDELVIENGRAKIIKRIGKIVLDGTENWGKYNVAFQMINAPAGNVFYRNASAYSNYFKYKYYASGITSIIQDGEFGWNASKLLTIRNDECSTVDEFKTWLSTHNTTVYYELATAIEIDLGAIDTLSTFDGINNVSLDANFTIPFTIKYYKEKETKKIPLNIVQSYEDGVKYQISKVIYESGELYWDKGDETANILYINSANPYITSQKDIDNIYAMVNGLKITSFSLKKQRGNPLLDCFDIIEIEDGDKKFKTLAQNELTYNGKILQTFDTTITQQAVIVNASKNSEATFKKYVKSEIDGVNGTLTTTVGKIDTIDTRENNNYIEIKEKFNDYTPVEQFVELENNVTRIQTDTYTKTEINTKLTDGSVTKVLTTAGTFDENGLTIEKTNAVSKGRFNEKGMTIIDATGSTDTELLFAGYDEEMGESVVRTKNTKVEKYLTIGANSRIEDYNGGTGVFHIGGN